MNTRIKHLVVYEYLRIYIDQNKFSSNTKLPSETFLTHKFSVCRETVRRAIKVLADKGLVYSIRGGGTYFDRAKAISFEDNKKGDRYLISLIIQGYDREANSALIKAAKSMLNTHNADIRLFYTDNKIANERNCLEFCKTGFDGMIIDGVKANIVNPNLDVYASLYAKNIPFIFYNNYYSGTNYPKIIIDDMECADLLVKELVDNGHRYICGIFLYDNYQGIMKYQGYIKAILKYNAVFDDKYVKFLISDNIERGTGFERIIWNFLKSIPRCSAIVCCNIMIYKAIKIVLAKHKLSIPENYSVVCFDYSANDYESESITCSLHPGTEIGRLLGTTIIEMIKNPNYKAKDYSCLLNPKIYKGTSVRNIT
ncbi:GntR family transcriptional regulator [Treponema parvum]|uniref:GntR family transcriptional regulator n=1 Tax=Treponema parvum TaxID=138851 RepID=A0A975F207_9SPIR|nr:GntR family transcriptional regulator [Treponema parvum]QTQ13145.1 GntR family transcriptional regulator [Treponema parvum]